MRCKLLGWCLCHWDDDCAVTSSLSFDGVKFVVVVAGGGGGGRRSGSVSGGAGAGWMLHYCYRNSCCCSGRHCSLSLFA